MDSKELREEFDRRMNKANEAARRNYETGRKIRRTRVIGPAAMVKEFHDGCGTVDPTEPTLPDPKRLELRKRLIEEEYQEFLDAIEEGDLVNAFKELADLIYVVAGTGVAMGGDLDAVFEEVHRSNMSKLTGEILRREDGKILKGPNYKEPNVKSALGL